MPNTPSKKPWLKLSKRLVPQAWLPLALRTLQEKAQLLQLAHQILLHLQSLLLRQAKPKLPVALPNANALGTAANQSRILNSHLPTDICNPYAIPIMKTFLLCSLCVTCLTGCHTGGSHHATLNPQQETVSFSPGHNVLLTPQMKGSLTGILERHGFTVAPKPPTTLLLETDLQHGITSVTACVRLVKDGHLALLGRSENYGWGTWMAPGPAQENVIQSAVMAFDRELGKACITPASPSLAGRRP